MHAGHLDIAREPTGNRAGLGQRYYSRAESGPPATQVRTHLSQVRRTASGAPRTPGLRNLPLKGFDQNQLWCEIVALACELLAWTQMLALAGAARQWEPKRLRLRLFSVAGRLAASGRRLRLRLAGRWPWTAEIAAAAARLQALPSG